MKQNKNCLLSQILQLSILILEFFLNPHYSYIHSHPFSKCLTKVSNHNDNVKLNEQASLRTHIICPKSKQLTTLFTEKFFPYFPNNSKKFSDCAPLLGSHPLHLPVFIPLQTAFSFQFKKQEKQKSAPPC